MFCYAFCVRATCISERVVKLKNAYQHEILNNILPRNLSDIFFYICLQTVQQVHIVLDLFYAGETPGKKP